MSEIYTFTVYIDTSQTFKIFNVYFDCLDKFVICLFLLNVEFSSLDRVHTYNGRNKVFEILFIHV